MNPSIVLASESPFRKTLMNQIGLNFETTKPLIDEDQLKSKTNLEPQKLPQYLAKAKAESLIKDYPNSLIIGADQVLILDGKTLDKPKNKEEVILRLQQLQGRSHQLHTSIAVYYQDQWICETVIAELTMKELNQKEIEKYYNLDQTIGCAGGYKIESRGPLLFTSIKTEDYFSIIGLPLLSLTKILRKFGISPL